MRFRQSIDQSIRSVSPITISLNVTTNEIAPINRSINPINQSVRSIDQSVNPSINQPIASAPALSSHCISISQSINRSINQSINHSTASLLFTHSLSHPHSPSACVTNVVSSRRLHAIDRSINQSDQSIPSIHQSTNRLSSCSHPIHRSSVEQSMHRPSQSISHSVQSINHSSASLSLTQSIHPLLPARIQLSQVLRPASRFKPAAQHIQSIRQSIYPSISPIDD
jgi:hypothetical protein